MNAFSSSRLAHGEGRIGVIAPIQSSQRSDDKKSGVHKHGGSAGGVKRKRPAASSDALFAEEDDQDDEEEERQSAPRMAKGKSATRQPPPQPQPKQRPQQARRPAHAHGPADEDDSGNGDGVGDDDGAEDEDGEDDGGRSSNAPAKKRRTAPEELSSKKAVSAGVIVTALPKFNIDKKRRDPRFDPMCGDFDAVHFHSHYAWMAKEKQAEISQWQSELRSGKVAGAGGKGARMTDEEREELRSRIQQSQQHLAALKREHSESSIVQKWKSAERKAQKETGKAAFHLKKSEVKKLQLAARYLDLKEKGGLQKFMVKRTKEVANRDHKYMPREGREEK